MQKISLTLRRIYEPPHPKDGMRILVDRLWPRGVRKTDASVDVWMKEIAPTPELRSWFGHDPGRFESFRVAYERQLVEDEIHVQAVQKIIQWVQLDPVTLLYAAKDPVNNHAVVLHDFIVAHIKLKGDM